MDLVYLTLEAPREGQASYTHVHEIISGLRERGWNVMLYQPSYTGDPVSPGLLRRLVAALGLQAGLWLRWRRGAVLYVRGHYLAFPSALIARMLGVKVFHEINGPYEDVFIAHPALNRVRRLLIWMQRYQYRRAAGLIAVTEELRQWALRESGGRRAFLISNGANTALFRPGLPKPAGLPARYVIFFGGLTRWHGVPVMVGAASHPDWPEGVDLVVAGDGPDREQLDRAAECNPRLRVLGKRPYAEIPALAASALAGLAPIGNPGRRSETGLFPLKLFETLSCGVPAIVTDFPGQADFVRQERCGLVIPADDPAALARAVAVLAADPGQAAAMGQRGHLAVLAGHSWDARAEATDRAIRDCL